MDKRLSYKDFSQMTGDEVTELLNEYRLSWDHENPGNYVLYRRNDLSSGESKQAE